MNDSNPYSAAEANLEPTDRTHLWRRVSFVLLSASGLVILLLGWLGVFELIVRRFIPTLAMTALLYLITGGSLMAAGYCLRKQRDRRAGAFGAVALLLVIGFVLNRVL